MYYITVPVEQHEPRLNTDDLIKRLITRNYYRPSEHTPYIKTRTYRSSSRGRPTESVYQDKLVKLANELDTIDMSWRSFRIPKRSGGMRQIHTPNDQLKDFQRRFIRTLVHPEPHRKFVWEHNIAHAFVERRSTLTALQAHRARGSRWFLKLDIKDFFDSFNHAFIMQQAMKIYPLYTIIPEFRRILPACMLDDRLPQGAVSSPLLTNLLMAPVDYELTRMFKGTYTLTRYADDLLISSRYAFNYKDVEQSVQNILTATTPFKLKHEKTRYGSCSGRNWNLGLMYNQDRQITIGHDNRRTLLAMMYNFTTQFGWTKEEAMELQGKWAYYQHIQPDQAKRDLDRIERKTTITYKARLKQVLNF